MKHMKQSDRQFKKLHHSTYYYQTCVIHVDYLYNVGHRKLSYQLAAKYRNVPQTMNKVLTTR